MLLRENGMRARARATKMLVRMAPRWGERRAVRAMEKFNCHPDSPYRRVCWLEDGGSEWELNPDCSLDGMPRRLVIFAGGEVKVREEER